MNIKKVIFSVAVVIGVLSPFIYDPANMVHPSKKLVPFTDAERNQFTTDLLNNCGPENANDERKAWRCLLTKVAVESGGRVEAGPKPADEIKVRGFCKSC